MEAATDRDLYTSLRRNWVACLVAATLFSIAFVSTLGLAKAGAFPLRKGACNAHTSISYGFVDGSLNWTATIEGWFNDYADTWDVIDDADGDTITSVSEGGSKDIILVAGGSNIDCGGGNFNDLEMNGTLAEGAFKGDTVHEIGHALGLDHTGQWDSFDSDQATMTGCAVTAKYLMKNIELDDVGSFAATFDDADLHGNASFEDNAGAWTQDLWIAGGGATLVNRSGTSPKGTRHGEIQGGGFIRQTVQVTDPGDMRAAFYARKELSAATGSVILMLKAREVEYDTLTSQDDCYGKWVNVNNWNLDRDPDIYPNGTVYTLYKSRLVSPTTSWPGSEWETTAWTAVDGWDGADVRVRVEHDMEFGGDPADIDVDHVRVRHLP